MLLQYTCKAQGLLKPSCLSALMRASVGLPRLGLYLRRSVEYMASCARPHSNEMLAQCPPTTVLLQRGTTIQYTRCLPENVQMNPLPVNVHDVIVCYMSY